MTQKDLFSAPPKQTALVKKKAAIAEKKARRANDIDQVWQYWRDRSGSGRPKISDEARKKVNTRMENGFTVSDICQGIDGMVQNQWWVGKSTRTISRVCKSDEYLEGLMESGRPKTQSEQMAELAKESPLIAGTILAQQQFDREHPEATQAHPEPDCEQYLLENE